MDNSFQTSFIPKKPITPNVNVRSSETTSIFSVVATILLILSVLGAGGLFAYKLYLTKQKAELSNSLLKARDSFEKETINELSLFNNRSKSAKDILANHVSLSSIFSTLGEITIPDVQYLRFEEQMTDKGVLTVNITGVARDYRSIAIQADMFNSDKASIFKNVLFSNLSKSKDGNVNFNLKFDVDRSSYLYSKNFSINEPTNEKDTKSINNITNQ